MAGTNVGIISVSFRANEGRLKKDLDRIKGSSLLI